MTNRTAIRCTVCNAPLSGGLDTYGLPFEELCQGCFLDQGGEPLNVFAEEIDESWPAPEDDDDSEFIERDGMTFCGACGVLACPGEEEFDWCDHRSGIGCYHMAESEFTELDDDDIEDELFEEDEI